MIYIIGDLHFNEPGITKVDGAKYTFDCEDRRNAYIINKWNSIADRNDTVFINGDIGVNLVDIIPRLNGIKNLIIGNHDIINPRGYMEIGFNNVYDHPIVLDDFYIISHEPMYVSEQSPYANIFAHVHNNPTYKTLSSRSFCTSGCRHDYAPISFEKIKVAIAEEAEKENDRSE